MILVLALTFAVLVQERAPRNEPDARLRAFVVDADGALLAEGWYVSAQRTEPRDTRPDVAPVDSATGVAQLADLGPGEYTVVAQGPQGVTSTPRTLQLGPDAQVEVELVYPSLDPALQVAVKLHGEGLNGQFVGRTNGLVVEAVAPDGTRTALAPRRAGGEVWAGAPPGDGPWQVIAASDCHAETGVEGVRRGSLADIVLVGNAALELLVVDAASGALLERFEVEELRPGPRNVSLPLNRATIPARIPGARRFEGFVPGWHELVVRAAGKAPRLLTLPSSFAPRATEALRVELRPEFVVRGRVVDTDGTPMPGIAVSATRGREAGLEPVGGTQFRRYGRLLGGAPDAATSSDADGWFTFEGLWQAEYTFRADFGLHCAATVMASLPLSELLPAAANPTVPGSAHTPMTRTVGVSAADGVRFLELECPPRARVEVEVEVVVPAAGLGPLDVWVETSESAAMRRATELVAARDPRMQLQPDGSVVVSRYRSAVRPQLSAAPRQAAPTPRARGSRVALEVDPQGRVSASCLVPPGEFHLHLAARPPGAEGQHVSVQGSNGSTSAPVAIETLVVEAKLGAPVRVVFDLRE